jgi:signal transduction histidine kinase
VVVTLVAAVAAESAVLCELEESKAREAILARDQERLRHARMLHDRVLQTMETLAGGQWIADTALKARVAQEAEWLRGLVEGADEAAGGDLLGQLSELVARAARDGLPVEFNHATVQGSGILARLEPQQSDALAGAVSEALTNVVKHAATASAVVRLAATPGTLVVTVLDHGCGFLPRDTARGHGAQGIRPRPDHGAGRHGPDRHRSRGAAPILRSPCRSRVTCLGILTAALPTPTAAVVDAAYLP